MNKNYLKSIISISQLLILYCGIFFIPQASNAGVHKAGKSSKWHTIPDAKMSNPNQGEISLKAFNTEYLDRYVVLTWQTDSEYKADYFEIESSFNGSNWVRIGQIPAQVNSDGSNNYTYLDNLTEMVKVGDVYYRLKEFDQNGKVAYSSVRSVRLNSNYSDFELYPNPTSGNFSIKLRNDESTTLRITDINGKEIYKNVITENGIVNTQIDISQYKKGPYFLQVSSEGNIINRVIVKE